MQKAGRKVPHGSRPSEREPGPGLIAWEANQVPGSAAQHSASRCARDTRGEDYSVTLLLKPPQIIRLPSNGWFLGSIMLASRLSFITAFMQRSRAARDL
jgi:hypothetical protein